MGLLDAHRRVDAEFHSAEAHLPVLEPEVVGPGFQAAFGNAQMKAGITAIVVMDRNPLLGGLNRLAAASVITLCRGMTPPWVTTG